MASLELHDLFSSLRYQPAHALAAIQSGARCRVCAKLYDEHNKYLGPGGSFCSAHRSDGPGFPAFVRACCKLQDDLKQIFKQMQPPPSVKPWMPLFGMTASELWWWEMLNVFQQQCENSLIVLGPIWEKMLEQGWCSTLGGPIIEIWEIKVAPPVYWHYGHCAFAIHLVSDGWWVFDPTGVQFGPDWPLLSRLDDYLARTKSNCQHRQAFARHRSLGTSRRLARLGRPPF